MSGLDELQERELLDAMENLARWVRHYFLRLVSEGFTEAQALALTRTWQRGVQGGSGGGDDE
jgi:hypothetical protein